MYFVFGDKSHAKSYAVELLTINKVVVSCGWLQIAGIFGHCNNLVVFIASLIALGVIMSKYNRALQRCCSCYVVFHFFLRKVDNL